MLHSYLISPYFLDAFVGDLFVMSQERIRCVVLNHKAEEGGSAEAMEE